MNPSSLIGIKAPAPLCPSPSETTEVAQPAPGKHCTPGEHAVPLGSTLSPWGAKASTLVITQLSKIDDKEPGLQKLTAKRTPRELVCLGVSRKTSKPKDGQTGLDMGHWRGDQRPSKSQSRGHRRCVWRAVAVS